MPDDAEARRAFGRWFRHLRGVRCRLQSLLLVGARDVGYVAKIRCDLGGSARGVRRGGWVMNHISDDAKDFLSDIVARFSAH
eukprot:7314690-Pyramimonas_sp.AAC.1